MTGETHTAKPLIVKESQENGEVLIISQSFPTILGICATFSKEKEYARNKYAKMRYLLSVVDPGTKKI